MLTYKTGVNGLDEMLKGGIPAKSITTLIGPAGSGKTIMSLQFLYNNLADGKICIYVSSSHSRKELVENSLAFGWDFMPYLENRQLIIMKFDPVKIKVKDSEIHLISGFQDFWMNFLNSCIPIRLM